MKFTANPLEPLRAKHYVPLVKAKNFQAKNQNLCKFNSFPKKVLHTIHRYVISILKERNQNLFLRIEQAGQLGFDSRDGEVGQSVASRSPPLRRFFGAVLPKKLSLGDGPRNSLHVSAKYRGYFDLFNVGLIADSVKVHDHS